MFMNSADKTEYSVPCLNCSEKSWLCYIVACNKLSATLDNVERDISLREERLQKERDAYHGVSQDRLSYLLG